MNNEKSSSDVFLIVGLSLYKNISDMLPFVYGSRCIQSTHYPSGLCVSRLRVYQTPFARSSNGRTPVFGTGYLGSSPSLAAI